MELVGRREECRAVKGVLHAVRAGSSQAQVVSGEPGIGKTAPLDALAGQAADCRVLRVTGVESEMEFAFATLHQVCAPLTGLRDHMPGPTHLAVADSYAKTPVSLQYQ